MRLIDADELIQSVGGLLPKKMPFDYDEDDNELGAILCEIGEVVDNQPTVNEWIPCSKRLPNESDYYMACIYNLEVDEYDFRKTWFAHTDDCDIDESGWQVMYSFEKVVAWMLLPEPYKEIDE